VKQRQEVGLRRLCSTLPPQSSSEFRPIPAIKWSLDLSQTLHTAGTTPSVRGRGKGGVFFAFTRLRPGGCTEALPILASGGLVMKKTILF
jgi:hypothetical protein